MLKRCFIVLLVICMFCSSGGIAFAENPDSLEAPRTLAVRSEEGAIMLRYTIPSSITDALSEGIDGDVYFCVDWKVNNGSWHYDYSVVNADAYDPDNATDSIFFALLGNIFWDENNIQELFFIPESFGLDTEFDLVGNKYTFRVRFAQSDYSAGDDQEYLLSPWSEEVSIGGGASVSTLKSLEAPKNLKVEVKEILDGSPYFRLSWTNPASVDTANQSFPIKIKADMKVGNGAWHSETVGHAWWGAEPYETFTEFDPVKKSIVDGIEIEKNTYYFRILYAYEPPDGTSVYSGFSNTVSAGIAAFYSFASPWAESFLQKADELGIVTDKMQGADMTLPITREEFAEIAVKFYEMVTGNVATAGDKSFLDTNNEEVLKAANLNITAGVGDGSKFEPKSYLLRQQMATMIVKTLQACYKNLVIDVSGQPDFKDQASFASYAIERAKFMAKYNITAGDGKGNFVPNANCTRQEAITFLVKAFEARDNYIY